ncbi:MAG: hypothetical protein A3F94_03010 [Candidatus Spechtbacteria bacterium RIFCSPLOWO2_12_FULL_38_22]|uniref:Uncharacterized protein n=1 Tax=Candidatus Spechtbacteria bacterium RIFCSPLOWO2_12_FULL_38_22 TaxID=1802165 RepID=A0A1G2HID6_9BACT|nr:MAG: hypothetical protein A3F94_03010 [Candidatus Spechtbacteria bacterium RIFCSPLOWO2_12_FULL_38_22]
MLNAPVSWFGASSSNPSGAQEAIGDYRNSIIDILKLTTEYVLQDMLTVENVIILVVLPDGQETQSIIPAGELISLLLGSNTVPDEAWLEKFSINSEDLTISEGLSIG